MPSEIFDSLWYSFGAIGRSICFFHRLLYISPCSYLFSAHCSWLGVYGCVEVCGKLFRLKSIAEDLPGKSSSCRSPICRYWLSVRHSVGIF